MADVEPNADRTGAGLAASRAMGVTAILFAVLFVVGATLPGATPDYDAADAEWVDWFDDSGNRMAMVIGMFLVLVAALALLVFIALAVSKLRSRLPASSPVVALVSVSGVATAVLLVVANLTISSSAAALTFAPDHDQVPSGELLKALDNLGIGMLLLGVGWSAVLFVASFAWAARTTQMLPSWLTVAGFVAAVLLLLSPAFLPLVVFPLWILVAGIVLLVRPPAGD